MFKPTALIQITGLIAVSVFAITGCSVSKPKPEADTGKEIVLETTPAKTAEEQEIDRLEQAIRQAQRQRNWVRYLELSEALWHRADDENQAAIEYMIWQTLSEAFDTPEKIEQLDQSGHESLQSWASFLDALQQPGLYADQALADVAAFHHDALFTRHLTHALKSKQLHRRIVRQVAVLLPFKGKYQQVSRQIRNGLLKAYMVSDRHIELRFYDTSEVGKVPQKFRQARQDGADFIIGPLTKAAIDTLKGEDPGQSLVLNSVEQSDFNAFNYRSQTESLQITRQLEYNRYQRIGILSSDAPRDIQTAYELMSQWHASPDNRAFLNQYEAKKLNLRKALGGLVNENKSQARYNNLRWLLGERMEFFPRTRQDLQAIILIGNEEQVAVFHPQFEFFQLKLPVYATSNLTPGNLQSIETNPDLGNVIFPAIPAIFTPHALNTPLEAFGWDSFLLATQKQKLAPNLCMTHAQSGILFQDSMGDIDKKLIWAQYSPQGELKKWVPPVRKPDDSTEQTVTEPPSITNENTQPTGSTDLLAIGTQRPEEKTQTGPASESPAFIPLDLRLKMALEAPIPGEEETNGEAAAAP